MKQKEQKNSMLFSIVITLEGRRGTTDKRIQGSKQEGSEGSEESKRGLDRCSVRGN